MVCRCSLQQRPEPCCSRRATHQLHRRAGCALRHKASMLGSGCFGKEMFCCDAPVHSVWCLDVLLHTPSTGALPTLATSVHTDRPARRWAHKLWKQQQKQQQQFVSMTQKQDVWYEVLQGDETSPAAASSSSSSSKDAFWVEHRRSPQESQQFRQQQKAHRPPVKQQTSVAGALSGICSRHSRC
jgi:hypothetical protein